MHNSAMSYVEIDAYLDYTAAAIAARASIPDQNAMVVSGSKVKCYKIDTRSIAAVLGEPVSSTIEELSSSSEVNIYSHFSPREWWDNSGSIESREKATVTKDNFAGYHHDAVEPMVNSFDMHIYPADTGIDIVVYLGEIDWASAVGAAYLRVVTSCGGVDYGYQDVSLSGGMTNGVVTVRVPVSLPFVSNQVLGSTVYFLDDAHAVIDTVPNISVVNTTFLASPIVLYFMSEDGVGQYQSIDIVTAAESWSVTSLPAWLSYAVYRGGSPAVAPYVTGDELRLYPNTPNQDANRTGSIVLTETVDITATQFGSDMEYIFTGGLTIDGGTAYITEHASTANVQFTVIAGLGTGLSYSCMIYKDGAGWIGSPYVSWAANGDLVDITLTGFSYGDFVNGSTYTIHVNPGS